MSLTVSPTTENSFRKYAIASIIAFAIAFALDGVIARAVSPIAPAFKASLFAHVLKVGGHFLFVLIIAVLLCIVHPQRWRAAVPLILTSMMAGLLYTLVKWPVGRIRPI